MKSLLISIQPKRCEKIAKREETIEVRKSRPKIETPFKAYIYCTKDNKTAFNNRNGNMFLSTKGWQDYSECNGKVIGEFVCDEVYEWKYDYCDGVDIDDDLILDTCLDREDINIYAKGKTLYGWHISDLKIYDNPKKLSEFRKACPDKFRYCEICKYGSVVLSPDEEEYALYHGGHYDCFDTVCNNRVTRSPQSWCYVEEIDE